MLIKRADFSIHLFFIRYLVFFSYIVVIKVFGSINQCLAKIIYRNCFAAINLRLIFTLFNKMYPDC